MKVIVDTVVWSLAFRRTDPDEAVCLKLTSLIEDQRVVFLGPIRQEVLSGYSDRDKFERLREKLSYFENEAILDEDYICAAEFHNTCRRKGIQVSQGRRFRLFVRQDLGLRKLTSEPGQAFLKSLPFHRWVPLVTSLTNLINYARMARR